MIFWSTAEAYLNLLCKSALSNGFTIVMLNVLFVCFATWSRCPSIPILPSFLGVRILLSCQLVFYLFEVLFNILLVLVYRTHIHIYFILSSKFSYFKKFFL